MGLKLLPYDPSCGCSAAGYPRACAVRLRRPKGWALKSFFRIQAKSGMAEKCTFTPTIFCKRETALLCLLQITLLLAAERF